MKAIKIYVLLCLIFAALMVVVLIVNSARHLQRNPPKPKPLPDNYKLMLNRQPVSIQAG